MGIISVSLPSDGTTADVSDYNTPITTIVNAINGNLDSNNISSVSGTKITSSSLPGTALDSTTRGGWVAGVLPAVSSVTNNGNRSFTVNFASTVASYLTPGQRLRLTRTVAAPTQCASLNGTTQYFSKASPNKSTFTDDFVAFARIKPTSYATGTIISIYNGTSGWALRMTASGQIQLVGYNAGSANFSQIISNQSVALNKWTNIYAQLDMSAFTATTTTSYVMFDEVDCTSIVSRGGTNPTALVQAGNLNVGAENGGTNPFPGKIAQAGWYTAKITQSTLAASAPQSLTGSETNLGSAYSFNGVLTDLNTTTPNDLTANGSAAATNADSPFALDSTGTPGGIYEWGIVTKVATTAVTVQTPEGSAIPTTGGVSAVDLSPWKVPFGFPAQTAKWRLETVCASDITTTSPTSGTWYNLVNLQVPIGEWMEGYEGAAFVNNTTNQPNALYTLSNVNNAASDNRFTVKAALGSTNNNIVQYVGRRNPQTETAMTTRYLNWSPTTASHNTVGFRGSVDTSYVVIYAENSHL